VGPALSDTDPETERIHLELIRKAPVARRLALSLSLSRTTMSLALEGVARTMPGASAEEVRLRFVALTYGRDLADGVRNLLGARRP
jgi:hypothetical protein